MQIIHRWLNQFKSLNSNEVDQIAGKTVKPKTRKQTIWGINVFKGNFKSYFFKFKCVKGKKRTNNNSMGTIKHTKTKPKDITFNNILFILRLVT